MEDTAKTELRQLELQIEGGLRSWVEVGDALTVISEKKLFGLRNYKSFKAYVEQRWRMSQTVAYNYMQAASVYHNLDEAGITQLPDSYCICQPLHRAGDADS